MAEEEQLQVLLARVEAATEPDVMLDRAIYECLRPVVTPDEHKAMYDRGEIEAYWFWMSSLDYTRFIDMAVKLLKFSLPGWGWRGGTCCVSDDCFIFPDYNDPEHGERLLREFPRLPDGREWADITDIDRRPSGNVPLAIIESILTALIEIERENHGPGGNDTEQAKAAAG